MKHDVTGKGDEVSLQPSEYLGVAPVYQEVAIVGLVRPDAECAGAGLPTGDGQLQRRVGDQAQLDKLLLKLGRALERRDVDDRAVRSGCGNGTGTDCGKRAVLVVAADLLEQLPDHGGHGFNC